MPENTRLGVWKRSTGFEVIHPYRRGYAFWIAVLAGLIALVVLSYGAYSMLPMDSETAREVLIIVCATVIATYLGFVLYKVHETHNTRIRVDITPRDLAISRVNPRGPTERLASFPLEKVDAVVIDGLRGIAMEGAEPGSHIGIWFGTGLRVPDLYYLALVLSQAMDGSPSPDSELLAQL
jgi:hypothetical protein